MLGLAGSDSHCQGLQCKYWGAQGCQAQDATLYAFAHQCIGNRKYTRAVLEATQDHWRRCHPGRGYGIPDPGGPHGPSIGAGPPGPAIGPAPPGPAPGPNCESRVPYLDDCRACLNDFTDPAIVARDCMRCCGRGQETGWSEEEDRACGKMCSDWISLHQPVP